MCRYIGQETIITLPANYNGQSYEIYRNAFENCSNLTSVVIPDSVTSIGASAFSGCISLTNITIPDSVTDIGWGAFYYCISLTNIVIPDSVTNIGASAFSRCENMESITIPSGVCGISSIFGYEFNSKSIVYKGTISQWKSEVGIYVMSGDAQLYDCTVYCDDGEITY